MKTWTELSQIEDARVVMEEADPRQQAILAIASSLDMITLLIMLNLKLEDTPDNGNMVIYVAPYLDAHFIELNTEELLLLAFKCSLTAMIRNGE